MTGLRAVALALLVTLGSLGGGVLAATQPGGSMSIQPVENGSNYLGPNATDVDRSGQATTSLDVAATVSANAGEVRSTFTRVSVRRNYEAAETPADRERVVRNGTDRLDDRVAALERREVAAIERYAAGDIQEADLFRTLAGIDAEAGERAETARWLATRARDLEMDDTASRLATLRIRLISLRGPVRDEIAAGLDGSNPTRVHVEVADGGIVLATTVRTDAGDTDYVREAYDPSIRTRGGTDRYGGNFGDVFDRLGEIYPWVNERNPGVDNPVRIGRDGARLYSIDFTYDGTSHTPYLDGGTGTVVKEEKRQQLDELPTERTNETSPDGTLEVTVGTTYASGPLGVTAVDTTTGEPVNATVLIDGDRVGHTMGGTAWTVAPRGDANVTVRHDGARVSTTVRAT